MRQAETSYKTVPSTSLISEEDLQALKDVLASSGKPEISRSDIQELGTSLLEFFELLAFDEVQLL